MRKWRFDYLWILFSAFLIFGVFACYRINVSDRPTGQFCNIDGTELKRVWVKNKGFRNIETNPPNIHCFVKREFGNTWLYCPKCPNYGEMCH
ncbi:MAG TPA: hypothetical protein VGB77_04270 [Abditibacteriaceae bacterium]|jgi:hypothetical protein